MEIAAQTIYFAMCWYSYSSDSGLLLSDLCVAFVVQAYYRRGDAHMGMGKF